MTKLKTLAYAVSLTLLAGSTCTYAAVANTVTVGVRGGYSIMNGSDGFSDEDNGYGYGIYAGYNFCPYFGIELGVNRFDGMEVRHSSYSNKADFYSQGPEAAARFAFPLDDKGSDIYLRAGAYWSSNYFDVNGHRYSNSEISPLVGLGVQYAFTKNFSVRAGYDHYFDVYDHQATGRTFGNSKVDLGYAYVGFQFNFGGSTPEPVAETPVVAQTVVKEHITTLNFDAETLFAFDSATVTENGQQVIKEKLNKLNSYDAQNLTFEVSGYTDRIGSDSYNQKLSEDRASAVANVLIDNGVNESSIVSVKGYGESNSVTGDKCDNVKGRDALVSCLAPDRRVEVSVNGDFVEEIEVTVEE